MLTKLKLFLCRLNLKWTEVDIKGIELWLEGVTTKDAAYLIIDAKEELTELRASRLKLVHKITKLEGEL